MEEYEKLYDQIQEVTNNALLFCGFQKLMGENSKKTAELLDKLMEAATEFADVAHELEEHFAWD